MEQVRPHAHPGAGHPRPPPPAADRARGRQGQGRARRRGRADPRAARDPRRRAARARHHQGGAATRSATRYGDERRTEITHSEDDIDIEDLIADQQMVIAITKSGYIKSLPLDTYRKQKRGGVGVTGMDMKDDDYIEHLFVCSTHDYLLFFTNRGKVYRQKVYELPEASRTAKGRALVNLLPLREGEFVRAVLSTRDFTEGKYLVFATRKGQIKKTEFLAYNTPIKADGIIAIKIRDDDELVAVRRTSGDDDIIMVSRSGQAARFNEDAGAADGPRHRRRARHERLARRQLRARDGHRPRRHRAARRDRERLRQAHADRRLPGQGPRRDGRQDDQADREEGRRRRRADRARAPGPRVHLAGRHGPAHRRQGDLPAGPPGPGRARDEPAARTTSSARSRSSMEDEADTAAPRSAESTDELPPVDGGRPEAAVDESTPGAIEADAEEPPRPPPRTHGRPPTDPSGGLLE